VFLATIEGEIEAKCFPGKRRTAWIDDVRWWTGDDDMNVARTNAMKKKIQLLVAGCLRVVRPTAYEQQQHYSLSVPNLMAEFRWREKNAIFDQYLALGLSRLSLYLENDTR